ncbi:MULTISPECIES: hypothetical protein [Paraburkholderia]|uniref:hypothetical protein n=1 Tax=Paraburkholderia TaxID=1822464 RepID=UPI0022565489|nr:MULTISPECIES: hypothetical protein [Paraburkholderia]MCX4159647.1 hypothetical protein [Paraburkholderia aspalathi]MDN7169045.1 hypothetical protein [Paraburkholderia sp. SECH2]MDQ6397532.1 hypothetical protein [Paraburkholderia aspalathi]
MHNLGGAIGLSVATIVYQVVADNWLSHAVAGRLPINSHGLEALVSDPLSAPARLSRYNLDPGEVGDLVRHYFMHGYNASMWLLLLVSLLAFGAVLFGLPNRRGPSR